MAITPLTKRRRAPAKPLSTLGALGLALGVSVGVVVIGAYALDAHSHRCECGNSWWHFGAFNSGSLSSHRCEQCGNVQLLKDGVLHVFQSTLRPPTPNTFVTRAELPQQQSPQVQALLPQQALLPGGTR